MKLSLKNIGKIRNATVELNGITVIAGENNSGKSTVGKVLYSVFNGLYNVDKKLKREREHSIDKLFAEYYGDAFNGLYLHEDTDDMTDKIIACMKDNNSEDLLRQSLIGLILKYNSKFGDGIQEEKLEQYIQRLVELLQVSDEQIIGGILNQKFIGEFGGQVNNIYTEEPGEIDLQIQEKNINIVVKDKTSYLVKKWISLRKETVYIDDPFVVDDMKNSNDWNRMKRMGSFVIPSLYKVSNHRMHLIEKLNVKNNKNVLEEIVATSRFEKIYNMIDSVCDGSIVQASTTSLGYRKKDSDKVLDTRNLSTGLKTFVVLKQLLINGVIETNGTIILDEPEIHLHPEWQLLFAELIVLLQKEFGMHILLNTHSPYFLNAIEVYAAKHEIADKCKYYMTKEVEECSDIVDVTDNIDVIYEKLARPLQKLENERYTND